MVARGCGLRRGVGRGGGGDPGRVPDLREDWASLPEERSFPAPPGRPLMNLGGPAIGPLALANAGVVRSVGERGMYKSKAYSAAGATSPMASAVIPRRDPAGRDVQIEILF